MVQTLQTADEATLVPQPTAPTGAAPIEDMNRLVRALAGRVHARLPRGCGIEMADLIQAGNIGLLQATQSFSPRSGTPLAGYAKFRIRGEMLDTVRRNAGPRLANFNRQSDNPADDIDLESRISAPPENSPHHVAASRQRATILGQELRRLPPRYQTVVKLRYAREFSLREIGAALQVHESRACQLHQSALACLRRALSRRGVNVLANLV